MGFLSLQGEKGQRRIERTDEREGGVRIQNRYKREWGMQKNISKIQNPGERVAERENKSYPRRCFERFGVFCLLIFCVECMVRNPPMSPSAYRNSLYKNFMLSRLSIKSINGQASVESMPMEGVNEIVYADIGGQSTTDVGGCKPQTFRENVGKGRVIANQWFEGFLKWANFQCPLDPVGNQ